MGTYPVLRFWARHGKTIALLAGICVAAATILAALLLHPLWLLAGLPAAGLVWLLLLSYAEVVHLLMDMLLPDPELG